jgi:hypothetical protein
MLLMRTLVTRQVVYRPSAAGMRPSSVQGQGETVPTVEKVPWGMYLQRVCKQPVG